MGRLNIGSLWQGLTGDKDGAGDRIVPPTGFTAQLTLFSAGAMAFLAVFALALPMISFVYGNYGFDTLFWLMATSAAIIFVAVACLPSKLPQPAAAAA